MRPARHASRPSSPSCSPRSRSTRGSGAERGVQLAQAAQSSAQALGLPEVEARGLHAEGYLRYGELLWAEAKDFHVPRESFARARDLLAQAGDASGVAQETFFLGLTEEQEGKLERAEPLYAEALRRPRRAAIARRRPMPSGTSGGRPRREGTSTGRSRCIGGASRSGRRSGWRVECPTP
jgi:hypothetical protein